MELWLFFFFIKLRSYLFLYYVHFFFLSVGAWPDFHTAYVWLIMCRMKSNARSCAIGHIAAQIVKSMYSNIPVELSFRGFPVKIL